MAIGFLTGTSSDRYEIAPDQILEHVILASMGTPQYVNLETGVNKTKVVPMTVDASIDASLGVPLGYHLGSGGVTWKDITLTNVVISFRETYQKNQLEGKILSFARKQGTNPEEMIAEDVILGLKQKELMQKNDRLVWQDSSANYFNGFIQQTVDASGNYIASSFPATSLDTVADASVLQIVNDYVGKWRVSLPQYALEDMTMFMSPANFMRYAEALYGKNSTITRDTIQGEVQEILVPGSNGKMKAVPVIGLIGRNEIFVSKGDNLSVNVDLEGEDETLKLFYSEAAGTGGAYHLDCVYKLGATIIDPTKLIAPAGIAL